MTKAIVGLFVLATVAAWGAQDISPLKTTEVTLSILTDAQEQTLYVFDLDGVGVSNCNNACASVWPPLAAPTTPVKAPLSVVVRKDGSKQLAFKTHPLYTYSGDSHTGDTHGDGLQAIWHVVHP